LPEVLAASPLALAPSSFSFSLSFSLSFLSLNKDVIPANEFLLANFPMEPIFRMTTDAEDMVDESEMLSVDAFNRELNKDAARDFFFPVVLAAPPPAGTGTTVPAVPAVSVLAASVASVALSTAATFADAPFDLDPDADPAADASSSSSCSACAAFNDNARLRRPLSPPLLTALVLPRPIDVLSSIAARSESSLDMRLSACEE
jgi:hypothetical protein